MHSKKGILSQPVMAVMVSRQTISNLEKGIVHPRIKLLVEPTKSRLNFNAHFPWTRSI